MLYVCMRCTVLEKERRGYLTYLLTAITVGWTGEGMDGGGYITSKIPEPDRRQGRHGMAFIWADSDADI